MTERRLSGVLLSLLSLALPGGASAQSGCTGGAITAPLPAVGDGFGHAVAIHGDVAVVGAPRADERCQGEASCNAGAVYAFLAEGECTGPADINDDGAADTRHVLAFLGLWAHGDCRADFNHDGTVNTVDALTYLNAYPNGCGP